MSSHHYFCKGGSFDFEGGDMVYDVHWSSEDGEGPVIDHVYAGKADVLNLLFDNVMESICDMAQEEYWRAHS